MVVQGCELAWFTVHFAYIRLFPTSLWQVDLENFHEISCPASDSPTALPEHINGIETLITQGARLVLLS